MNPLHIAIIGTRLVALYLIAQGISSIPNVYLFITTYNPADPGEPYALAVYATVLTAIFSPAITGFLLWLVAPRLGKYFTSSPPAPATQTDINLDQFQSAVIVLIGVYMLAANIPAAISVNYQLFTNTIEINGKTSFKLSILSNAISVNLHLLVGCILIAGSNFILRGINKLRNIGTSSSHEG